MAIDQEQVRKMLASLPHGGLFIGRKEVMELPNILGDDERVLDVVQGFYGNGTGILVSTQRRLLFVDKGLLYGLRVEDFPFDKISSIQYSTGMLLGTITIHASGNRAEIKNVEKAHTRRFAEGVRLLIDQSSRAAKVSSPQQTRGSIAMELERLVALKNMGALSDQEFSDAKAQVLGQLVMPVVQTQRDEVAPSESPDSVEPHGDAIASAPDAEVLPPQRPSARARTKQPTAPRPKASNIAAWIGCGGILVMGLLFASFAIDASKPDPKEQQQRDDLNRHRATDFKEALLAINKTWHFDVACEGDHVWVTIPNEWFQLTEKGKYDVVRAVHESWSRMIQSNKATVTLKGVGGATLGGHKLIDGDYVER